MLLLMRVGVCFMKKQLIKLDEKTLPRTMKCIKHKSKTFKTLSIGLPVDDRVEQINISRNISSK